ncbi:helix-turn-helix transcriptional regulator [Salinibaculum rarum]|uniref:helix-turn-helix transcriptional regulator n=1 Tax=Salinibaculum rarum TaxID=3058903 RepID=UPI00265F0C98|nr:MarR family transcriptional regulator [Salinibaculum sp. KK48]
MGTTQYTQSETVETLQFLVGSEVRIRLLATLNESRDDARTLVDKLDVPHSTVQRNLNKLENRGWIDATVNRQYYTTPVGEMVLDSLDGLLGTVESMDGLAAFVDCVPFDDFDIDLDLLAEADCVVADSDTPAAPLNEFVELLAESSGFTLVTPHWNPAYSDVIERQLDAGNEVQLVTTESQRSLLTGRGVSAIEESLDSDNLTVRLSEDTLPFGLAIVDCTVALVGYRDGALRVLVESDDPAIAQWTDRYLDGIEATAKPLRKQIQ